MGKLKWEKPLELNDEEELLKKLEIKYGESWSHYGVIYQVIEALVKAKFASRKEIRECWRDILNAY